MHTMQDRTLYSVAADTAALQDTEEMTLDYLLNGKRVTVIVTKPQL